MIRRRNGAGRFDIYEISEVLSLISMKKIASEMILQWMRSSILSRCRCFSPRVMCFIVWVSATARASEYYNNC